MTFMCVCKRSKLHASNEPKACMGCSMCHTAYARVGSNHVVREDHKFEPSIESVGKVLKCSECGYVEPFSYLKLIQD